MSNTADEILQFRDMVRQRINQILPDDIRAEARKGYAHVSGPNEKRWQRTLYEQGGWSCPDWPKEFGGPGWNVEQQYVFERELALAGAPHLSLFGHGMLGPTLMKHGTPFQQEEFLPKILRGDILLCQGYSEPNSGSDLASLRCKAEPTEGGFVLNGSKTWTSNAQNADWMFGLFRSSQRERPQQGISVLLVDMQSEGVTIRPIIGFEEEHEVNEVFFDDVFVPDRYLIGAQDDGWTIAKYVLSLERFGSAEISQSLVFLNKLKELARKTQRGETLLIDDPDFRAEIARVEVELRAVEATEHLVVFGMDNELKDAGPSLLKIRGTEVQQRITELAAQALGEAAHLGFRIPGGNATCVEHRPALHEEVVSIYLNMRKLSIYSGSNEIMKNILAKHTLGLR